MSKNLNNWWKSIIILIILFGIIYILGKIFVPFELMANNESYYKWSPFLYCLFLIAPILIIKYSQRKILKIIFFVIILIFLITIILIALFLYQGSNISDSENLFVKFFSILYASAWPGMKILLLF
ncbi:MAG TPA: hypothetical protein PK367_01205 [Candidatus Paceibacterota bacterium]|nr:hypothetical protein [Candidatus Paceibacterota bacterium]